MFPAANRGACLRSPLLAVEGSAHVRDNISAYKLHTSCIAKYGITSERRRGLLVEENAFGPTSDEERRLGESTQRSVMRSHLEICSVFHLLLEGDERGDRNKIQSPCTCRAGPFLPVRFPAGRTASVPPSHFIQSCLQSKSNPLRGPPPSQRNRSRALQSHSIDSRRAQLHSEMEVSSSDTLYFICLSDLSVGRTAKASP